MNNEQNFTPNTDARLADSCLSREHDIEQMASRLAQTLADSTTGTNDDPIHETIGDAYVLGWRDRDKDWDFARLGWLEEERANICDSCESYKTLHTEFIDLQEEVEKRDQRIVGLAGLAAQMLDLLERNVIYSPRALANLRVHLSELKQGEGSDRAC